MRSLFLLVSILSLVPVFASANVPVPVPRDITTTADEPNPGFPLDYESLERIGAELFAAMERDGNVDDVGALAEWTCKWNRQNTMTCEYVFNLPVDYCWYGRIYVSANYEYSRGSQARLLDYAKEWRAD